MNFGIYYIFITALIPSYEDMVIAALVKSGLQVSSLSKDNIVTLSDKDSVSAVIALRIDIDIDSDLNIMSATHLLDKIKDTLKELKILYYSLVVTESADCAWNISPIKFMKSLPSPKPPPLPNTGKPDPSLN